jgi:hypothetical protein
LRSICASLHALAQNSVFRIFRPRLEVCRDRVDSSREKDARDLSRLEDRLGIL